MAAKVDRDLMAYGQIIIELARKHAARLSRLGNLR